VSPKVLLIAVASVSILAPVAGYAGRDFAWEPIPDSLWTVSEDSTREIFDAIILFEKIHANDRKWLDDKCYYSVYRRLKVLSPEGRKWGDVTIPYIKKNQKVEDIRGRTVLPGGSSFELQDSQVLEKKVIDAKGISVNQKWFSLPGVTDDCIIEYYYRLRLPSSPNLWEIQKDIYMATGEYVWDFYRGRGIPLAFYDIYLNAITPNYLALNTSNKLGIDIQPSSDDPRKIVFTIHDVPPFVPEPLSLPDIALKEQLRCYYGSSEEPSSFWNKLSRAARDEIEHFTRKDKRARRVVEGFDPTLTEKERILTAYSWVREDIRNIDYEEGPNNYKDNHNVDDVIKHGYGTSEDINRTFYDMLIRMGIDAKYAFTVDRDDNFFIYDAKYWQFDRSLIGVPKGNNGFSYYNPGDRYLPAGSVAWYSEGEPIFFVDYTRRQFLRIPFSNPETNRTHRFLSLKMDRDLNFSGEMLEQFRGQEAYVLRAALSPLTQEERTAHLRKLLSDRFNGAEPDSIQVEGIDEPQKIVKVTCRIDFHPAGLLQGDILLLKPGKFLSREGSPFVSSAREYTIFFDHASELTEVLQVNLPAGWKVEALPPDTLFSNSIGLCQTTTSFFDNQKTLAIQSMFRLKGPRWEARNYAAVQRLFHARDTFEERTILIKRRK